MTPPAVDGICSLCNSELYGKVIMIAGKNYHHRCFCCCQCRKPLSSEAFRMRKVFFEVFSNLYFRTIYIALIATVLSLKECVPSVRTILPMTNLSKPWESSTIAYVLPCLV